MKSAAKPRPCWRFSIGSIVLALAILLSGCVNHMAAHMAYDDQAALAAADKKECETGDKAACVKLQRATDVCREMIDRGDTSAAGLICQKLVANGDISK